MKQKVSFLKNERNTELWFGLIVLFLSLIMPTHGFAQEIGTVYDAYEENDPGKFEKILLSHVVKTVEKSNDTSKDIDILLNSFLRYYTLETRHGRGNDFMQNLGNEVYIVLQPKVKVCFVDDLTHHESTEILKDGDPGADYTFPHRGTFNDSFLSIGYYQFPNEHNCREHNYNIDTVDKERYIPIRIDSNFVKEVQVFLNNFLGKEHQDRKNFIKRFLKLNPTNKVEMDGSTRNEISFFSYNFLIDKIIFNHQMNRAEIQFSYHNTVFEADFIQAEGRWIKVKVRVIMQT